MTSNEFRDWIEKNNIIGITLEKFTEHFNSGNYKNDAFVTLVKSDIDVRVRDVSLKLKFSSNKGIKEAQEEVSVALDLYYLNMQMGEFILDFDLNGKEHSSLTSWNITYLGLNQTVSFLEGLKADMKQIALEEPEDGKVRETVLATIERRLNDIREEAVRRAKDIRK